MCSRHIESRSIRNHHLFRSSRKGLKEWEWNHSLRCCCRRNHRLILLLWSRNRTIHLFPLFCLFGVFCPFFRLILGLRLLHRCLPHLPHRLLILHYFHRFHHFHRFRRLHCRFRLRLRDQGFHLPRCLQRRSRHLILLQSRLRL